MYLNKLPEDILFIIFNNIDLHKLHNIELVSNNISIIFNNYIQYQYKCSLKILKNNLNSYNKHINILYNLLNINKNLINNLIHYSYDMTCCTLIFLARICFSNSYLSTLIK